MKITTFKATIKSIRPLIMHNGRLRDPLDKHSKALSSAVKKSKTSKSDDDILDVHRLEFMGSLYFDPRLGPVIPADNLQAMLTEGARKRKLGKQVEALVQVTEPDDGSSGYRLEYAGPRDPEKMWEDDRFRFTKACKVGTSAVMRTRPRFPDWKVSFNLETIEGGPTKDQLEEALEDAGLLVGLGDWTPRYGRFELVSLVLS
jgi:hypothetical protein